MLVSAFLMGMLGSLHCLGMCGPIALVVEGKGARSTVSRRLLYNGGRVITYTVLGSIGGAIGTVVFISGLQQGMSVVIGVVMVVTVSGLGLTKTGSFGALAGIIFKVKNSLGSVLKKRGPWSALVAGILNGFLPCGLVYMAVAVSLTSHSIFQGALYMAVFGAGTVPALFMTSAIMNWVGQRVALRRVVPVFIALVGILLIVRGLGLGIPYLSPSPDMEHHH